MRAPWAAVPLPAGRFVPSGNTVMSQALISASVMGLPRPGRSAADAETQLRARQTAAASGLGIDMLDLPAALDAPAGQAVVVLAGEAADIGKGLGLAALRHEVGAQGLRVAGFVPGAALQHDRPAVPAPRHAEAGKGLRLHRLL